MLTELAEETVIRMPNFLKTMGIDQGIVYVFGKFIPAPQIPAPQIPAPQRSVEELTVIETLSKVLYA